jgi:hypothetical protein
MTSVSSRTVDPSCVQTRAPLMAVLRVAFPILLAACGTKESSASAAGSWTGSLSAPGTTPIDIRFVLEEQNGTLIGRTWVEDPETHELLEDADLTGSRLGSDATWTTSTDLVVSGRFEGNHFVGTLDFPPEDPLAFHRVDVVLDR